jgi:hypothetical protein
MPRDNDMAAFVKDAQTLEFVSERLIDPNAGVPVRFTLKPGPSGLKVL